MGAKERRSSVLELLRESGHGPFAAGPYDAITDVPGVKVGHVTLTSGPAVGALGPAVVRTGVTAVLPRVGNLFRNKVRAAAHVINGFGKAVGLWQVRELGEIETPIVLTNTLSVATAAEGVLDYMLAQDREIGVTRGTVNPVVLECNDGYLNDIRGRHVRREHVLEAIALASGGNVERGCVGAGTGMVSFGFKGGIGTASRLIPVDPGAHPPFSGNESPCYTLGTLVLANYGRPEDLVVRGLPVGRILRERRLAWLKQHMPENSGGARSLDEHRTRAGDGSVIVILATDAPLGRTGLLRVARRAAAGIARTGSYHATGSGDFVVAFSTAAEVDVPEAATLDNLFAATVDVVETAVLDALFSAHTTVGREGRVVPALSEFDADLEALLDKPARELFF